MAILIVYFLCQAAFTWTIYFIRISLSPTREPSTVEQRSYLWLAIMNFLIEVTIGVVFCTLWKYFSDVARGIVPSGTHSLVNCAITFITLLYFVNCAIFELLDPVMTIFSLRNETKFNWENFFA